VRFPLFVARRYFLSKRKKNFINVIAVLSMTGVAFATAALVIVLSVFNGIGDLLRSLYSAFDPPLKVTHVKSKSFQFSDTLRKKIYNLKGVEIVTEVIEDYVYLRNRTDDTQADMVVTMKGVSDNFLEQHRMDDFITIGTFKLYQDKTPCAVVGSGVRNMLSIRIENNLVPLQVYYVKDVGSGVVNPASMYSQMSVLPAGVFTIEKNFDENYIFVPLDFAEDLLSYKGRRTSLEIKPEKGISLTQLQASLEQLLGSEFKVLSNDEQHRDLYRLLKLEKVFTFLALALLIVVASINIYFSLMMLVIDKRKDIGILTAMGASDSLISRIFISEAAIIAGYGTLFGLVGGVLFCFLQQTIGLVGMGMDSAIVSNYPVKLVFTDLLLILCFNALITLLISWHPARLGMRYANALPGQS
jgi:lipoprotein-releasing system permease protein